MRPDPKLSTLNKPAHILEPSDYRIQSILISRFILSLREANSSRGGSEEVVSHISGLMFRTPTIAGIVGNMGEPLDHRSRDGLDGDIDEADADLQGHGQIVDHAASEFSAPQEVAEP